jgi:sulfonate transport system permease protein
MARPVRARLVGLIAPVAVVLVWQLVESAGLLNYDYLPAPLEVLAAAATLIRTGDMADAVSHTLVVTLTAATLSMVFGAALGLAIGLLPKLRAYLVASIDFLRAIPAAALVPVAVMAFGPSATTELMLVVYAGLWPVVLCTAAGAASVHPRQYDVARMLHLSRGATVQKIVIPAAVPAWLIGARLCAVIALLVSIVAEMLMNMRGLGGGLVQSLNALAPARMWAYALVCGAIGFVLNAALSRLVGLVLPGSPANADNHIDVSIQGAALQPRSSLRGLLPLALVLVAWQLLGHSDSVFFPPPKQWVTAIGRLHDSGVLMPAVAQTLSTFVFGLALAAVIGSAVGVAIGASHRVDHALTPTIAFLAAVPAAAMVPAATLLLGPTQLSGVVVVGLIAAWPILLAAAAAMRTVPIVRLEMSRTLGLTRTQRWTKVIAPSLAPGLMLGVRIASAMALIVTLLVDIFGVGAGLGRLLVESQQRFEAATAWGLLLMIGAFGYLTSAVLARVGRRVYTDRDNTLPNWSSRSI